MSKWIDQWMHEMAALWSSLNESIAMSVSRWRIKWPVVAIISLAAVALWLAFRPVHRSVEVSEQIAFRIPDAYSRVRAVLVRKDATRAILEHAGMRLIDQQIRGVQVDASQDRRPLLHAVLGNSQSELNAEKLITVEVTDPYASTDRLELLQTAVIEPEQLRVDTRSTGRRGNLTHYETSLHANSDGVDTAMTLTLAMGLQIEVPWVFSWRVPADAQLSAQQQLQGQRDAILSLMAKSANEAIILPELGHDEVDPEHGLVRQMLFGAVDRSRE